MQPSRRHVLTSVKIDRLGELGRRLDPSFGNYVRVFPNGEPVAHIADGITPALVEVYDANLVHLDVQSDWIAKQRCPPCNGPKQDRAGAIEDPPPFPSGAIRACAYAPPPESGPRPLTGATEELIDIFGARVSGEIGRLRVNLDRELYVAFDTGIGFVSAPPRTSRPRFIAKPSPPTRGRRWPPSSLPTASRACMPPASPTPVACRTIGSGTRSTDSTTRRLRARCWPFYTTHAGM